MVSVDCPARIPGNHDSSLSVVEEEEGLELGVPPLALGCVPGQRLPVSHLCVQARQQATQPAACAAATRSGGQLGTGDGAGSRTELNLGALRFDPVEPGGAPPPVRELVSSYLLPPWPQRAEALLPTRALLPQTSGQEGHSCSANTQITWPEDKTRGGGQRI